jgi:hypothetical protein
LTGKKSYTLLPPPGPSWEPCPTCAGTGKRKVSRPGNIVIRTKCHPRPGAPDWSDSLKEIAHALGILEVFIRIGILEKEILPLPIGGKQFFLLDEVQEWYDSFPDGPSARFEDLLMKAFPNLFFIFDATLGGYTIDRKGTRRIRSHWGR